MGGGRLRGVGVVVGGYQPGVNVPLKALFLYLKPLKTQLIYRLFLPFRDTLCALFIAKSACPSPENRSAKTELNLAHLVDFWVKNDKIIKI